MRLVNPSILRSASLIDPSNNVFNMQLARVVHCAGNDARRLFVDTDDLRVWAGTALTEPERERLRAFLSNRN
jgi:hypothetical protein